MKRDFDEELLGHYLAGETNNSENEDIKEWVAQSEHNSKVFNKLVYLWKSIGHLKELKQYNVYSAKKKVHRKIKIQQSKTKVFTLLYRAAAILIIPLIAYIVLTQNKQQISKDKELEQIVFTELSVSFGNRSELILPDGSKVWLNSGSKLKYPDRFNPKARVVYLEGEGYFEVKANETLPFLVNVGDWVPSFLKL